MRIFGISITTIVIVLAAIYVGKKFGGSIPVIKSL